MAHNQSRTDHPTRHTRRSLRTANVETLGLSEVTPSMVSNVVGETEVNLRKRKKQSKPESGKTHLTFIPNLSFHNLLTELLVNT